MQVSLAEHLREEDVNHYLDGLGRMTEAEIEREEEEDRNERVEYAIRAALEFCENVEEARRVYAGLVEFFVFGGE